MAHVLSNGIISGFSSLEFKLEKESELDVEISRLLFEAGDLFTTGIGFCPLRKDLLINNLDETFIFFAFEQKLKNTVNESKSFVGTFLLEIPN
jgi:hypothetical protein